MGRNRKPSQAIAVFGHPNPVCLYSPRNRTPFSRCQFQDNTTTNNLLPLGLLRACDRAKIRLHSPQPVQAFGRQPPSLSDKPSSWNTSSTLSTAQPPYLTRPVPHAPCAAAPSPVLDRRLSICAEPELPYFAESENAWHALRL